MRHVNDTREGRERGRWSSVDEEEHEQVVTALEDSQAAVERLGAELGRSRVDAETWKARALRAEYQLAKSHARLLAAQTEARADKSGADANLREDLGTLSEELRVSNEELQVTIEELEEANAELRQLKDSLEGLVATRTAELSRAVAERDALLRRRELLAREIDHRVKNSLMTVGSLIRLQKAKLRAPEARHALEIAIARIEAIAGVHAMLYASGAEETVDFGAYLREVCRKLGETIGADGRFRILDVTCDSFILDADTAIALAIIVNELVTNAFHHAFSPAESGVVRVECRHDKGSLTLVVADDGRGLPADRPAGLGTLVTATLAEQVGASLDAASEAGTRVTVRLPLSGQRNSRRMSGR